VFGQWVDNGADAKHGADLAKLGPQLAHHIQSAVHTNTSLFAQKIYSKITGVAMMAVPGLYKQLTATICIKCV